MVQGLDIGKWKDYFATDAHQAVGELCGRSTEEIAAVAEALGVDALGDMAASLATDVAAALLRNLSDELRQAVLKRIPADRGRLLQEILSYASGTAGALMAKEVLAVPLEATIGEAISYLQSIPEDRKGKVSYIYVVDQNRRLRGVIQVRDLIFYASSKPVQDILKSPVVQVETGMSQLDVARLLQRHRYLGLPVVDADQKLAGVISADAAMQVFENEAVDDLVKLVGTSAEEFKTHSVRKILASRLPWLFVNIVSGLVCAFIAGLFRQDVKIVGTLFLFVPIVLGLSESTGVQGATIVVRNLAMGRVSWRDMGSLFVREAVVGIVTGLACGVLVGFIASWWQASGRVGLALAVSMASAVIVSSSIGLVLPMAFKRLKIDPALASGPFVLALCDIQTLVIYFNLSAAILRGV